MKKTLGGDRLGSGNKMQVELHNYGRSTHDLGYIWRSTMASGTLVPFMQQIGLPGDTFDIDLDLDVKTHPTLGPLFGSYKAQADVFICPLRLYQGQLHNNKLGIGMNMASVKLPLIELDATVFIPEDVPDLDNAQINPSCILAYQGIRGVGINVPAHANDPRQFNGIPLLMYWDTYKNYYANKQEEIGAVIHTPQPALITTVTNPIDIFTDGTTYPIDQVGTPGINVPLKAGTSLEINYTVQTPRLDQIILVMSDGTRISVQELAFSASDDGTKWTIIYNAGKYGELATNNWDYIQPTELPKLPPRVQTFDLNDIDVMREMILAAATSAAPFIVNTPNLEPYRYVLGTTNGYNHMLSTQEGLGLKTYQSDLFNNWLSTEWIDGPGGINDITAIDTTGGSFTIDTLNLSKKVYDMLNRIAVSGGTYDDWLDAVYTQERARKPESPIYVGGLIRELVFQEVVSNSQSTNAEGSAQPLGTLAGKGVMAQKKKGGKVVIKIDEPCYIMGIISLTPRVDYSQGNKWDTHLLTMDDLHKPALDEIGFQELITEQMAWWDTHRVVGGTAAFVQSSAGKQPAWINYMTNTNETHGNFAIDGNEMFMTLNRRYEADGVTGAITDLTTYIDPSKFNNIFAETALDAQNFWVQIAVDITARRVMSAKVMPNL